ncbi:XRE family transcriptional regulator, partial [Lactobacillus helveticus]
MDIGKKLKSTRVFLDLISILNYHNISLYDFFASADKTVHDKKRVMQSFINDDANRLKKYQHLLKPAQKKYQLEFKLMLSILNDQIGELPKGTIEKAQRQFIRIGKLDINTLFYI